MKAMNRKSLLVTGVSALALTFGTAVYAEKGAETLVRLTKGAAPAKAAPTAVVTPTMACPKCADVLTTEVNRQAKAGQVLAGTATQKVVKHACTDCSTKITTVGTGKAKHNVAIHTCSADIKALCCASN